MDVQIVYRGINVTNVNFLCKNAVAKQMCACLNGALTASQKTKTANATKLLIDRLVYMSIAPNANLVLQAQTTTNKISEVSKQPFMALGEKYLVRYPFYRENGTSWKMSCVLYYFKDIYTNINQL